MKVIKILTGKAQDPEEIFDTDKKNPGLNFVPQSPDLIGSSPDTSPDVSVFPLRVSLTLELSSSKNLGLAI